MTDPTLHLTGPTLHLTGPTPHLTGPTAVWKAQLERPNLKGSTDPTEMIWWSISFIMISRIFSTWEPSRRLKGGVLLATKLILARYGLSQFSTTADDPLDPTVAEARCPKVRKTVDWALQGRCVIPPIFSTWRLCSGYRSGSQMDNLLGLPRYVLCKSCEATWTTSYG